MGNNTFVSLSVKSIKPCPRFFAGVNNLKKPIDIGLKMYYNKYRINPIFKGHINVDEFEIIFYEKNDGTMPAKEFLDSLDVKMRAKMVRTVVMLKCSGHELREPYSKPLSEGIFELRAKVGSDISRVLYFFVTGRTAVLTNGFIKKTQKSPKEEIERAKRYRADYLSRKENNEND